MYGRVIMSTIQQAAKKEGPWNAVNCPIRPGNCAMGCQDIKLTLTSIRLCQSALQGRTLQRVPPPDKTKN